MALLDQFEPIFIRAVDGAFARVPQPPPSQRRLREISIFSHRGEHADDNVIENSMAAFEKAQAAGVGGIEFDVRWTKDRVPVIFHDVDLMRIFNVHRRLSTFTMAQLRRDFPKIPSLEEVIAVFGKHLHLMIELKMEHFPDPGGQQNCLKNLLGSLTAGRDFHLMSLTPQIFKLFNGFPAKTYLPIAKMDAGSMSKMSLKEGFGGLTGHYVFINNGMIAHHHRFSQKIGTGFVESRNSLFREINRGVDWIFSNRAGWLQKLVNAMAGYDNL